MPMSPRLLRPLTRSGDSDVRAYIAAVEAADQQALEQGVRDAIRDFIVGCKADGIWSAIKSSCILMGARTLSGALTPLVGSAPTNNGPFVSGDYNRETGLVGNGTNKFLDTNRANNADGQNDFSHGVFVTENGASSNHAYIGLGAFTDSGASHVLFQTPPTVANSRGLARNRHDITVGDFMESLQSFSAGLYGTTRNTSASFSGRFAGTGVSQNRVSTLPGSQTHYIFNANLRTLWSTARISFYWVGSNISLSQLDSRVTTLYNAIGAAIP